jgi:hypothetical protein
MADDPDDAHFSDELLDVANGLRTKALQPLGDYLRTGGLRESPEGTVAIPTWLARELADMIEGKPECWFHLVLKGRKRGEKGWAGEAKRRLRDAMIGRFVDRRMRELGRGSFETAWREACDKFNVKKPTVTAALRKFRERSFG